MPNSISSAASTSVRAGNALRAIGKAVKSIVGRKNVPAFEDYPLAAKSVCRSAIARYIVAAYFKSDPDAAHVIQHLVRENLANKLVAFVRANGSNTSCFDLEMTTKGKFKVVSTRVLKAVTSVSGWPAPIADGTMKHFLADCIAHFADSRNHWQAFEGVWVTSPFVRSPTTPHLWHIWVPAAKLTADNIFGHFSHHDQVPGLAQLVAAPSTAAKAVSDSRKRADRDQDGDDEFNMPSSKRVRRGSAQFDQTPILPVPMPRPQPRTHQSRKRRSSKDDRPAIKRAHVDEE